jgi:hypothetical protein
MFKRQSKQQHETLQARGITPGKRSKTNKWGQASGGWSPTAAKQREICPTCDGARTWDAYDKKTNTWATIHCPRCAA